uniref:Uncharacterized protein n=1 Tax=Sinocyclocheilus grahami TaxID=75366 RepID=A0A672NTP9_SINGR
MFFIEENKDNKTASTERGRAAVVFSLKNEVGGLVKALKLFQENHVNLVHIESRKSKRRNSEFEIFVDCDSNREQLHEILQLLRKHVNVLEMDAPDNRLPEESEMENVPWFPKKISDLDKCANRVLMYGSDLDADHPGFKDNVYRKRRKYFADLAMSYKQAHRLHHQACGWVSLPTRLPGRSGLPCVSLHSVCATQLRSPLHTRAVSTQTIRC